MPRPLLRKGDKNDDVRKLQDLLNRIGSLLGLDGDFGNGTKGAVEAAQREAEVPLTGEADEATWEWLEAQPEPSGELSCEGVTFIVKEEVSSRAYYDKFVTKPHFPGTESGVTIGVGYDLRFQDESFENDWASDLTAAQIDRLRPWLGKKGSKEAVAGLADIRVPFRSAWRIFTKRTLPKFIGQTRGAYQTLDDLPGLRKATLVSLVYNRGASMGGDSRREMREIRDALAAEQPEKVSEILESMKRLWPDSEGLRKRRDHEAALWRRGLA